MTAPVDHVPTSDELAELAYRLLPAPVIDHAAMGLSVEQLIDYPDLGLLAFGERLVLLGGLALGALYVNLASEDETVRSDHYSDYIKTILFRRGYDRGIAAAFFQKANTVQWKHGDLRGDDLAIITLIGLRRSGAANSVRARMHMPLEFAVKNVIERVAFLRHFNLGNPDATTFAGQPVELWPFLIHDQQGLLRLRDVRQRGPTASAELLEWVNGDESEPVTQRISALQQRSIERIAGIIQYSLPQTQLRIDVRTPESVIPLLADTHPQMSKLAELLMDKADHDTITAQCLYPFLKADRSDVTYEEARSYVDNEIMVENAIIRQCLENDPITVLKNFLTVERGDALACLHALAGEDADKIYDRVRSKGEQLRKELEPVYPAESSRSAIEAKVNAYVAHLAAQKIASLLGFRIIEQNARYSIDDYIARVSALAAYVNGKRRDTVKIASGLLECAKMAEKIIRFIVAFYTALKYYDATLEEGLHDADKSRLRKHIEDIRRKSFDSAIKRFEALPGDDGVRHAVRAHLGRGMWTERDHARHIEMFDTLRKGWRNKYAHEIGAIDTGAQPLVMKFLDFLSWLKDPTNRDSSRDRIYPAVLHLNVLTMNQCGITSIKYNLTETAPRDEEQRSIRLYTRQPLARFAGTFYGLPNQDKSQEDLWIDPVLIPTTIFPSDDRDADA